MVIPNNLLNSHRRDTPFNIVYWTKAILPTEIGVEMTHILTFHLILKRPISLLLISSFAPPQLFFVEPTQTLTRLVLILVHLSAITKLPAPSEQLTLNLLLLWPWILPLLLRLA